jgi:NAD(P)H dehydrogenase (quinone)
MNHLVVLAHPREGSFTRDICGVYTRAVRALGHAVVLRDLYAMKFNPVASVEDITGNRTGRVPADIKIEQDHLVWADVIALFHPIWWIDRPAILKGWIDRVFAIGFAYGHGPNGPVGTLKGKRAIIFTSAGSTQDHFDQSGKMQAIRVAQDMGTMEFCNIDMIEHVHFSPVGSRSTPEMVEGYKRQVEERVRMHFGDRLVPATGEVSRA